MLILKFIVTRDYYLISFLLLFLCGSNKASAQSDPNSISLTPLASLSIFAPDGNLQGSFYGGEAAYQLNMADNNVEWIRLLHVQDISFTAAWLNLQGIYNGGTAASRGMPGNTYAALTIVDMSFLHAGSTRFFFSPGIGLAYATQTYYINNYNPHVGSHINLAVQAGVKLETPVFPSTRLTLGVDFFHYSNSAFKLPNDGINNINTTIGLVRDLKLTGPDREKATFAIDDKQSLEIGIGFGRRGFIQAGAYINPKTGKPVPLPDSAAQKSATSNLYMSGMYIGYAYRLNSLLSLKLGSDMVYYFRPFSWDDFYRTFQESGTSYDHLAVGVSAGLDLWLGRMAFMANYGYYLHYNSIYPTHFYRTIGGKYYLNSWLALNIKMYIHGFEAQYANFGVVFNVR